MSRLPGDSEKNTTTKATHIAGTRKRASRRRHQCRMLDGNAHGKARLSGSQLTAMTCRKYHHGWKWWLGLA